MLGGSEADVLDADEYIREIQSVAKDMLRYAYRWLSGQPTEFEDLPSFLRSLESVEAKIQAGATATDVLNGLTELAIASKISSLAREVKRICDAHVRDAGDVPDTRRVQADFSPLSVATAKLAQQTILRWRDRLSGIGPLTLQEMRDLPSFSSESEENQEALAFLIALRASEARMKSTRNLRAEKPVVVCNDLLVSPGGDFTVQVANLAIRAGEVVACVGPNGAGKTTFLRTLAGSISPKAGAVSYPLLDAQEHQRHDLKWPWRRRFISTLEEDPKLDGMALDRRIALNLSTTGIQGDANRALTNMFLERFRLFDKIGRPFEHLSSGEKKLAGLACALSSSPKLLILDEPLSAIDYLATVHFLDDIVRIAKRPFWGRPAIIVSTHHLDEMTWAADIHLFFHEGRATVLRRGSESPRLFEFILTAGSLFEAKTSPACDSRIQFHSIGGRTFAMVDGNITLSAICGELEALGLSVLSLSDITHSSKRQFLGL